MKEPKCVQCGATAEPGTQWPMTPKTEGFTFGHICSACDEKPKEKESSI